MGPIEIIYEDSTKASGGTRYLLLILLDFYTRDRTAIRRLFCALRPCGPDDFGLAGIFVKFEDIGAYLCADATPYAIVTVESNLHASSPPVNYVGL